MVLHLRKRDRQAQGPKLIDDPHAWTEEVLGSVVWSASADVRIGLEAFGEDGRVLFNGYRRGDGELGPRILRHRMEVVDGEPRPVAFELAPSEEAARALLAPMIADKFTQLPIGEAITWEGLMEIGLPKSSASRMVARAEAAGLLEGDRQAKVFRRKA
jgi:hypothetical protein